MTRRFTGRQLTTVIVAVCVTIVAAPVAALATTGTFTSSSPSTPAVSATNSSSGAGAKAVYGNASATSGSAFGVYGHATSGRGYGVYSAGRLGTSGALVCSHCVSGADVNASTFPTVPDAGKLAGHSPSYYARIVPLSWIGTPDAHVGHGLADVGGVIVYAECYVVGGLNVVTISLAADSDADAGTVNAFVVTASQYASAEGFALSAVPQQVSDSFGTSQTEGAATYRRNSDGRVVTIDFHLYGASCEVFGNVLTAG